MPLIVMKCLELNTIFFLVLAYFWIRIHALEDNIDLKIVLRRFWIGIFRIFEIFTTIVFVFYTVKFIVFYIHIFLMETDYLNGNYLHWS